MLNSLEWTDRNKSALVLEELTRKRDTALLKLLRERAVPALVEMARWKNADTPECPSIFSVASVDYPTMKSGKRGWAASTKI